MRVGQAESSCEAQRKARLPCRCCAHTPSQPTEHAWPHRQPGIDHLPGSWARCAAAACKTWRPRAAGQTPQTPATRSRQGQRNRLRQGVRACGVAGQSHERTHSGVPRDAHAWPSNWTHAARAHAPQPHLHQARHRLRVGKLGGIGQTAAAGCGRRQVAALPPPGQGKHVIVNRLGNLHLDRGRANTAFGFKTGCFRAAALLHDKVLHAAATVRLCVLPSEACRLSHLVGVAQGDDERGAGGAVCIHALRPHCGQEGEKRANILIAWFQCESGYVALRPPSSGAGRQVN